MPTRRDQPRAFLAKAKLGKGITRNFIVAPSMTTIARRAAPAFSLGIAFDPVRRKIEYNSHRSTLRRVESKVGRLRAEIERPVRKQGITGNNPSSKGRVEETEAR